VGLFLVPKGAVNVSAGRGFLSIDIRSGDDDARTAAVADVLAAITSIAARRKVDVTVERVLETASVPCAPRLQRALAAAITRASGDAAPLHLPSGAGHDAMKMASIAPVGMLFVRCGNGGISHHPDEVLDAGDAELATSAFLHFLQDYVPSP
jgi:acetylornithine deacetylase/succinyl-diaminopimelate desuccinylase-like protein